MRVATGTQNLRPRPEKTFVDAFLDTFLVYALRETWPTGTGVELRVGVEQVGLAAHALVRAVLVIVPVLAGESAFRTGTAGDIELFG